MKKPIQVCGICGCYRVKTIHGWTTFDKSLYQTFVKKGAIATLCDKHEKLRKKVHELAETI